MGNIPIVMVRQAIFSEIRDTKTGEIWRGGSTHAPCKKTVLVRPDEGLRVTSRVLRYTSSRG
jgi:hypothetical protein